MRYTPVCHVYGAGEFFDITPQVEPHDIVIAADGGFNALERIGLAADYVIGDFDSLHAIPPNCNIIQLPEQKDITDMRAALELGLEKGFREFGIYGGTGGRLEHTLANIQCLAWLAQSNARGYLHDDSCTVTAITNSSISFGKESSGYFSVFAHSDNAKGVYLTGFKYPLVDAALTNTFPIGVSNEFIGVESSASVRDGTLIVAYPFSVKPL